MGYTSILRKFPVNSDASAKDNGPLKGLRKRALRQVAFAWKSAFLYAILRRQPGYRSQLLNLRPVALRPHLSMGLPLSPQSIIFSISSII